MMRNVGTIDRVIRVTMGAVLCALALASVIGPWGYLGLILLLTGVFGKCLPIRSSASALVRRMGEGAVQRLRIIAASLALLGAAVLWLGFKALILWVTRD